MHYLVLKSKEMSAIYYNVRKCSKNDMDMSEGHRRQPGRASTDQIYDDFRIEIITDNLLNIIGILDSVILVCYTMEC